MHNLKKFFMVLFYIIKDNFFYFMSLIVLYIIFTFPINYYIVVGGGCSDVSSRIHVEDAYKSKGSLNISYVTELKGTVITYLLSYIVPTWEALDANDYKYDDKESIDDIEFRSDLDLISANGKATYWAYTLADRSLSLKVNDLYIISVYSKYDTSLKIKDKIISIDGKKFDSVKEYREYIQTKNVGDTVLVKVIRNKKEEDIKAPIYKYENTKVLGIALEYVREYDTSPKVDIKFRSSESGPSGGLISTLEIYNQLTKKDITKGYKIAGTGTIEEDGSIGQIGGVEHKLLGAVSDKSDIFLVPSGENYKQAMKYKKKNKLKIKIIAVKTINDAIEKLEKL